MIKKTSIAVLGLITAFLAAGRTVTPEEALNRIQTDRKAMKVAGTAAVKPALVHTAFTQEGIPAAYVFNGAGNKGFMILPADDIAAPLLGYGDNAVEADAMPPQLTWWLGEYAKEIAAASAPTTIVAEAPSDNTAYATDRKPITPMLKTIWNQDEPFNNLCPRSGLNRTYTGCVATAMAQVMKYFNYPEKGSGTGHCTIMSSMGMPIGEDTMDLDVEFAWNDMLNNYNGNYTATEGEAVATLMKACGYAVNMAYSTTASGAASTEVPKAFVDNFGYDKGCRMLERLHYSITDWEQLIYDNLRDCGPVFYSGYAVSGGHAFVCDGYSSEGMFHINWGWGGSYNGYFRLTALEPAGQGIGGYIGGYNLDQIAVLGIRKPVEGSVYPPQQLTQVGALSVTEDGSRINVNGGWANFTGRTISCMLAVSFEPAAGGEAYIRSLSKCEIPASLGLQQISIPKSYMGKLADGTYKLQFLTKENGTDEWLPILHNINIPSYVLVTKEGSKFNCENAEIATLTCLSAELDIPFCFYTTGKMTVELKNETTIEVPGNLSVALLSGGAVMARSGGAFFDLLPGQEETRTFEFLMSLFDNFEFNTTYTIVLYDTMTGKILKEMGTTETSLGTQPVITCSSFTIEGEKFAAVLDNLNFNATFTCTTGAYANDIVLGIFPAAGGSAIADQVADQTLFLNTNESKESRFHLDLSDIASINTYYLALPYYVNYKIEFGQLRPSLLPAAANNQVIRFKATAYSGLETVADDAAELRVYFNPALKSAIVNGPADIKTVEVFNTAGAMIPATVATDGTTATIDLSTVPTGAIIVRAADTAGNTVASKLMVR